MPLNFGDLMNQYAGQYAASLQPGAAPFVPSAGVGAQSFGFGPLSGTPTDSWRSIPNAMDFNAMAQGLSGGVYQPPVRNVNFNFPTQGSPGSVPQVPPTQVGVPGVMPNNPFPVGGPIQSLPPAPVVPPSGEIGLIAPLPGGATIGGVDTLPISQMPLGPIGGGPSGVGSIDWTEGSSIVTAPGEGMGDVYGGPAISTGSSALSPVTLPGYATGVDAPAAPVVSESSYLGQFGDALGGAWDYLATNGGNPYTPSTGNMNDPGYDWSRTTTGDAGGVGHQLAGLLNMGVIEGGGFGSGSGEGGSGFVADFGGGLEGNMLGDTYQGRLAFARTLGLL